MGSEMCIRDRVTGGRPRSKEGIRLMRQQAEKNAPWYMFAHLTLPYPAEDSASIHVDIMELLSHTLARRPPSEEDVRHASTVVADLLPTFFVIEKSKRAANGTGSSSASATVGGLPDGSGSDGQVRSGLQFFILPVAGDTLLLLCCAVPGAYGLFH